jgi:hypothetical protein
MNTCCTQGLLLLPGNLPGRLLTDHMPVEVYRNGAIKNDDLLINGYFAWWNKMATSLPLDYEPN